MPDRPRGFTRPISPPGRTLTLPRPSQAHAYSRTPHPSRAFALHFQATLRGEHGGIPRDQPRIITTRKTAASRIIYLVKYGQCITEWTYRADHIESAIQIYTMMHADIVRTTPFLYRHQNHTPTVCVCVLAGHSRQGDRQSRQRILDRGAPRQRALYLPNHNGHDVQDPRGGDHGRHVRQYHGRHRSGGSAGIWPRTHPSPLLP